MPLPIELLDSIRRNKVALKGPVLGLSGGAVVRLDSTDPLQANLASQGDAERLAAAGIAVAIPAHAAYNYLVSRINKIVLDMERAAGEVVNIVTEIGHAK